MRAIYSLLVILLSPAAVGYMLWRGRRDPAYRRNLGQRLGRVPEGLPAEPLWIHAASVGEVQAVSSLIQALLAREDTPPLLVTTVTPTGRERLRERFGDRVAHAYLPLDLPGATRRFLGRLRPRLGVIVERELWPNLIAAANARGVPLVLANARLSERSLRGYRRFGRFAGLLAEVLDGFALIDAQTEADARRLRRLGAPAERLRVGGNLKFDQSVSEAMTTEGRRLRERLGGRRPVWVAASTHDGEDEAVLAAHRRVRAACPAAGLILVPRHRERFEAVVRLCRREGFTVARRTEGEGADGGVEVYVGDTLGELPMFLAAADVAFVGGSLVRLGGHNPLEPAALGLPVLTGPQVFNFTRVFELLEDAGGVRTVCSADELADAVTALLADPAVRERMGRAAESVVAANRGARDRLLAAVTALLAGRDPMAEAPPAEREARGARTEC